ncbi:prolyl aminopeptidase [Streptomyces aidingensis]|uniref:Proline iminopeptidase n=1 Tax=Streptomyces aidingensis TaxID=910347 RepID=A0A1I1NMN5_9ACTN|nr:prolyl aminopeptidase [Streptomyces aidingensis]SFC98705.1 proline iminopeptidase [Streptomyces aidingensis]
MRTAPYPPFEPRRHGLLDVGDGHHIHWEEGGSPRGRPALAVHGGPGSGTRTGGGHGLLDPQRYRIIRFDQRNCGRSTPHAADPATSLAHNTTHHLVADMERLRVHLGVERWLLHGGSWGSTLILAYAEAHPERVSEIVIAAVTTTRRSEIDWLYRGVGRFFPEALHRFRTAPGLPAFPADAPPATPDLLAAYARLMEHPDPAVRERTADAWCAWEDTVLSLEDNPGPSPFGGRPSPDRQALVRICAHYFSHGAWLREGQLLAEAHRLKGIPGVLVHGRLDLGGPPDTAWELARAWPDARLVIVAESGHLGTETSRARVRAAFDEFAGRP